MVRTIQKLWSVTVRKQLGRDRDDCYRRVVTNGGCPPPAIVEFARRATLDRAQPPALVRLHQRGEMRQKPGGRWVNWAGVEEMAVRSVEFSWRARFPILPGLWLVVEDSYARGVGALKGRLWGRIPLFRSSGIDVNVAQAMRYLAELPWVPHAMVTNSMLHWVTIDARLVEVSLPSFDPRAVTRFEFDRDGDIASVGAPSRPRSERGATIETPWGGTFGDYAVLDGLRIPRHAEVHWDPPEGRFVYWRGEVTAVQTVS